MITGINESKTLTRHMSCESKINLIKENVIQINAVVTINVDVDVKIIYMKKIIFGIVPHVFVKLENN